MDKIIQIIPAIETYAIFKNKKGIEFEEKIDLIALGEEGELCYFSSDGLGCFEDPTKVNNFIRINKRKKEK